MSESKKSGRHRDNLTAAMRRRIARMALQAKPKPRRLTRLEAAMHVLRRTGVAVHDAGVDEPRAKGLVRVGERKYEPSVVISMAQDVLEREAARNAELRKEKGLG